MMIALRIPRLTFVASPALPSSPLVAARPTSGTQCMALRPCAGETYPKAHPCFLSANLPALACVVGAMRVSERLAAGK